MTEWRLYLRGQFTGIAIRPDPKYPKMWRIHGRNQISDMVNINRAKDAGVVWARPKGLGGTEQADWRKRQMPANRASVA